MKRAVLILTIVLLFVGCDSYLEERLAFLELPFEYEGSFDGRDYNLGWDLAWGVPDNGDDQGVYFCSWNGDLIYWSKDQLHHIYNLGGSDLRPLASIAKPGMFFLVTDTGNDSIQLFTTDLNFWFVNPQGSFNTALPGGLQRLSARGDQLYLGAIEPDPQIDFYAVDVPTASYTTPPTSILASGSLLFTDVLNAAFPSASSFWGPASVRFHAFAPASTASYEGEHKYILSRTDGLTGVQRTVLVSINQTSFAFTVREIGASSDFYFISRDRFVGMDGDTLVIFNADGDKLATHTLEGMRLLGFRSSADRELVFLYTSDENEGDRVWGIYSLPASFIEETE